MPIVLRNLTTTPSDSEESLPAHVARKFNLHVNEILDFRILRKGIDARKKSRIRIVYTVSFSTRDEDVFFSRYADKADLERQPSVSPQFFAPVSTSARIVIAGTGPAGLFTALRLAEYGLTAIIVERGKPVDERARDVGYFWNDGTLNPESNVQFGEGGAGTFSDGKLTCRTKDPNTSWVLDRLASFGAPPEVNYLAKPHIGSDRLRTVVVAIRRHLQERGFEIRFGARLSDITTRNCRITGLSINGCEELPCTLLVLATGHSARDTYELLEHRGVPLCRKPFAMGLRVEHPQELIDRIQYGIKGHPSLPVADYALTYNSVKSGRSAYSFCMCPGGVVIGGSSEAEGVVTNGMSLHQRNSDYANSALVVNVREHDFEGSGPLAGIRLQRSWERKAFELGGRNYRAPAQNLLDFMRLPGGRRCTSSYRPGVTECNLEETLPSFISETLREGIPAFEQKMRGFITAEACLVGIESRTSSPVRILRGDNFQSVGLAGLYPAGEGAGYAGGIMSSALDGIRIADAIANMLRIT